MQKTRSVELWEIANPLNEDWLKHIEYSVMMSYLSQAGRWAYFCQNRFSQRPDFTPLEYLASYFAKEKARKFAKRNFCQLVWEGQILVFGYSAKPRKMEYPQSIHPDYIRPHSVDFKNSQIRFEDRQFINVRIIRKDRLPKGYNDVLSGPIGFEQLATEIIAACEIQFPDFWQLPKQQQCQKIHDIQKAHQFPELAISDASLRRYLQNYRSIEN